VYARGKGSGDSSMVMEERVLLHTFQLSPESFQQYSPLP
jgi:hypothetical protein